MYKIITVTFITGSLIVNPIFASNFFQKLNSAQPTKKINSALQASSRLKEGNNDFTDFSGTWVGKCTGYEETETTTIKNTYYGFEVDGMRFEVGGLTTFSTSDQMHTQFVHMLLDWNADNSKLLMNASFTHFNNKQDFYENTFGYGIGSIALINDQLIIEMNSQTSEGNDHAVCTYNKQ